MWCLCASVSTTTLNQKSLRTLLCLFSPLYQNFLYDLIWSVLLHQPSQYYKSQISNSTHYVFLVSILPFNNPVPQGLWVFLSSSIAILKKSPSDFRCLLWDLCQIYQISLSPPIWVRVSVSGLYQKDASCRCMSVLFSVFSAQIATASTPWTNREISNQELAFSFFEIYKVFSINAWTLPFLSASSTV